MIHTMTIFKEINSYEAQHLLSCMGYSISELEDLAPASWENIHPMCGIADVTLTKSSMSLKYYGIRYDRYTIYLRMEPLTLVTGEQHIDLFECTKRIAICRTIDKPRKHLSSDDRAAVWAS